MPRDPAELVLLDLGLPGEDDSRSRVISQLIAQCTIAINAGVRALDRDSGVPVLNGLAHAAHPTRLLADEMTMQDAAAGAAPLLCVAGQPHESIAAWKRLAPLAGMRICARNDPAPHGEDDDHAGGFFYEPNGARRCDDGGPALCKRDGTRSAVLAQQQTANHALLVRALLLPALG